MKQILIVEDDKPISNLIQMTLKMGGFESQKAFDFNQALNLLKSNTFDMVLLDISLPDISGIEIIPRIKKKEVPIIIISAKDQLTDKVYGLESGADDYMTKPFETAELLARINALFRRSSSSKKCYTLDDLNIDIESRTVIKNGHNVLLTTKEFDLLHYLLENSSIAIRRESLIEKIWGYDTECSTRTVDIHIQRLRKKLGIEKIETVYKVGYKLNI